MGTHASQAAERNARQPEELNSRQQHSETCPRNLSALHVLASNREERSGLRAVRFAVGKPPF
jgi:hypothetical protein